MSQYTQTPSYGAGYATPDQSNHPYIPPAYPNQYMQPDGNAGGQPHIASNYDASMSAYSYNRALPAFSAASIASGVPPLPIYQGWNQDSVPLPPYSAPQSSPPYANYPNDSQNDSQYYPVMAHQNYVPQTQSSKPYEQGELSEGEFEDSNMTTNNPPAGYGQSNPRDVTNYNSNHSQSGYSRSQGHNQAESYPADSYNYPPKAPQKLCQSDSYTPYASPAVTTADHGRPKYKNNSNSYTHYRPEDSNNHNQYKPSYNDANRATDFIYKNSRAEISPPGKHNKASKVVPSHSGSLASLNGSHAAVEVNLKQKRAQAATDAVSELHRLAGLQYDTFIQEGFRESEVRRLFDELKLPRPATLPLPPTTSQSSSLPSKPSTFTGHSQATSAEQPPKPSLKTEVQKEAKVSVTATTPLQPQPSAPKSAAMTEKERTLKSKMDALRKSREERAQKQAAEKDNLISVKKTDLTPTEVVPEPKKIAEPVKTVSTVSRDPTSPRNAPEQKSALSSLPPPVKAKSPPTVNAQPRSHPSIPGLFFASSNTIPGLNLSSMTSVNNPTPSAANTAKKRPVASDWNDTTNDVPLKRPFGHHRDDRPLVIDISEDDGDSQDEDIEMDLESAGDQYSPMQPQRATNGLSASVPSVVPLSEKVYQSFTPPTFSSTHSTPPLLVNPPKVAYNKPGDLKRVESEMEALKRRIAEKEAKQRAKQTPTRALTPRVLDSNGAKSGIVSEMNDNLANKVGEVTQMQKMVTLADDQAFIDQQKLASLKAEENEKAAELQTREDEKKRSLREQNATDQSLVDAEVLQTQTKLEELRAAMAEAEADFQRSIAKKAELKKEAERLEEEAEQQARRIMPANVTVTQAPDSTGPTTNGNLEQNASDSPPTPTPAASSDIYQEEVVAAPIIPASHSQLVDQAASPSPINGAIPGLSSASESIQPQVPNDVQESQTNSATDKALEDALQEAVRAEADLHADRDDGELDDGEIEEDEGDMDIDMDLEDELDDSFAPDPAVLAPEATSHGADDETSEYLPVLHRAPSPAADLDMDEYEPPEAVPADQPIVDSPPFSPAPPRKKTPTPPPFIQASPVLVHEAVYEALENSNPAAVEDAPIVAGEENMLIDAPQGIDEDVQNGTGELLPSMIGSSPKPVQNGSDGNSSASHYTPYESPLKIFRAYRFHPEFAHAVTGGLKSKTYSHKIDPNHEFCRYELAGGVCNDPTCDFQHFKNIGLQDDAVLTALGSPDQFTGEERDRFCAGLREVLMSLRQRKVKDFNVIASEIIAHRANFLGDKSKVLALDGTTI